MFRIEAFVEDNKLPRVLHALTGLVQGQPSVQPVANAKTVNGKVVARVVNGDRIKILGQELRQRKMSEVRPADIKAFAVAHGLSEKSYSVILKQAIEHGLLKKKRGTKAGNKIVYEVVDGGTK